MNTEIILSICIASYNHGESLHPKIKRILEYTGNDLEVIISDNGSTDGTLGILQSISDNRLNLLSALENKGPTFNYVKALAAGTGKYVMFMTDKDSLVFENIELVISILKNADFATGYFTLDHKGGESNIQYASNQFDCLQYFAYLSKHPTGYIYKNDLLKSLNILTNFSDTTAVGYFPFEFICAELCTHQKCAILNMPFCITAKLILGQQTEVSMTYSGKTGNLFFSPEKRFEMFEKYSAHLHSMHISRKIRIEMSTIILHRAYTEAVYGYINAIQNEAMRIHYRIDPKSVGNVNIADLKTFFLKSLLRCKSAFKNNAEKVLVTVTFISKI
jgi:glycosyltransferase involved in cell wall biosynthesis